jgi:hypothetical protein
MMTTGFSDRSMWVTEFFVTLMLLACATLGFCNSDKQSATKIQGKK